MPVSNNVTRLLDARKVRYQLFELSAEKHSALETARLLNVPPEIVFKTIVVTREKGKPLLVVIPAAHAVNLKAVAAFVNEKKVHLPTQRDAEKLTGLQSGGISPLALINKGFQVLLDSAAQQHAEIHVSAGQRGLNVRLPVIALAQLTNARYAAISQPAENTDETSE